MKEFCCAEDEGVVPVTIGNVTKPLDMLDVLNHIEEVRAVAGGDPKAFWEGLKKMLVDDYGFPPGTSLVAAKRFYDWHTEQLVELGKAGPGGSKPDSPGSTEPPSSISPPPSA